MTAQNVQVVFSCPACGAEGYDIELDGDEIARGVQISFVCDECPHKIYVDVDVRIQHEPPRQ